jgi:hypothetical protein
MAQHAQPSNDPVLVLVGDEELLGSFDDWLALVATDGPTDTNVGAAEILREFRDKGES